MGRRGEHDPDIGVGAEDRIFWSTDMPLGTGTQQATGQCMTDIDKPLHPGEVLRNEVIKPLGLTVTAAARRFAFTRKALSELLNGKSAVSPRMAIRIGKATGVGAENWLTMQMKLDLWEVRQTEAQSIDAEVRQGSLKVPWSVAFQARPRDQASASG